MGRVYNVIFFQRRVKGGETPGGLDYKVNSQGLPEGAQVVCVMDDTGKTVFCGGVTPDSPAETKKSTLAECIRWVVDVVRSEHDPEFGKRAEPDSERSIGVTAVLAVINKYEQCALTLAAQVAELQTLSGGLKLIIQRETESDNSSSTNGG